MADITKWTKLVSSLSLAFLISPAWAQEIGKETPNAVVMIRSADQNPGNSLASFTMAGEGVQILYDTITQLKKGQIITERTSEYIRTIKMGKSLSCSKIEYIKSKKVEYGCYADVLETGETGIFEP